MFWIKKFLLVLLIAGWGLLSAKAQSEQEKTNVVPIGWASQDGGTNGGAGGEVVEVSSGGELKKHAASSSAKIIRVTGELKTGINIGSNTTIEGAAPGATIGSIVMNGVKNIILRNLIIHHSGGGDLINVTNTQHAWIDHCELINGPDGILDLARGCDFWTVSWTKVRYTYTNKGHRYSFLFGTRDSDGGTDRGKLRITLHHNWWADNVTERMPRVRFGKVHVFNSYYASEGNRYCIRAAKEAKLLVENNYFDNVNDPHQFYSSDAEMVAIGNIYIGKADNSKKETRGEAFKPPYEYKLDPAESVKEIVKTGAGPFNKAKIVSALSFSPPKSGLTPGFFDIRTAGYDAAGRFSQGKHQGKVLRVGK